MNIIALLLDVCADDLIAERVIISSNDSVNKFNYLQFKIENSSNTFNT